MELTDGRTPQKHAFTKNSDAQGDAKDRAQDNVKALVAARDARERCARSRSRRLQADKRQEDRGITQAFSGAQLAPQGWRLSLGTFDADVLRQPRRKESAEDPANPTGAREDRVETSVREGMTEVLKPRECSP